MTVDPWRVAQIAVSGGPGHEDSRGSGYLIAPGRVLTAAHVVATASVVRVRLDVGQDAEINVQAEGWWADPAGHQGTDLAVITIPETATAGRTVEPARFGRISDCAAVLVVEAFGFPLFKLRDAPANAGQASVFRDFEQATGHAPVAANRRQGTLAVYLDDPPPSQPRKGDPSPWEGMSGGPVLVGDRIVGVVAAHHPSEGTGRLTARRIDHAYAELQASDVSRLAEWLGLTSAVSGLPDVVPVSQGQLIQSAYLAQVRAIAPAELVGRNDELAEWAMFCAGAEPYTWWQAGPWAGKSALASWFVLHPPVGVNVVSFFVTGRFIGQADSAAFLDAMIEQLSALYQVGEEFPVMAGPPTGVWLNALESAAIQAKERARRLVVVVDGLDEDNAGATPSRGRPSIASLLPCDPPPGVRIIVTSRRDPGLPGDVSVGHPLRVCTPHSLQVSRVAEGIELLAKQELGDLLSGNQIAVDVVGYIAGSGGGLTRGDLSTLSETPPYKIDPILGGAAGRSLQTRPSQDPHGGQDAPATRVYLFAHDTLRVTAEEQLGSDLGRYRQEVHKWIRSYGDAGWPDTTPAYAIRGYLGLLTATRDATRLLALARDPRRHAFLRQATGSNYAALVEIENAQGLIAAEDVPNLEAVVELALQRYVLPRGSYIPYGLPIVWAKLARFDHAEALAGDNAQTLVKVAIVAAQVGDLDRAYQIATKASTLAGNLPEYFYKQLALEGLAVTIAQAGDPDRAEALARTFPDRYLQAQAFTELVTVAAKADDADRAYRLAADAEAIARTLPKQYSQVFMLIKLADAVAEIGNPDRAQWITAGAEALACTITDPRLQARYLGELATAAAQAGDLDRAEALARSIKGPHSRMRALGELAAVAARAGNPDLADRMAADAEAFARSITEPHVQASALHSLAVAAEQAGDHDRAHRMAADAETVAGTITDPKDLARVLRAMTTAAAQAGDLDRAEAIARTSTDPKVQADALSAFVTAAAEAGDLHRAEAVARTITDPSHHGWAHRAMATAAAQAGDLDRAEAIARTITDPSHHEWALRETATAAAQAGDLDRAEAIARTITDPSHHEWALRETATAAAQAGDLDRAEAIARTITDPSHHEWALRETATAAAQAGDLDRAEAIACTITDPEDQVRAHLKLVTAAVRAGDSARARHIAAAAEAAVRTITDPRDQVRARAELGTAAALAGDSARAHHIIVTAAEAAVRTITDPEDQAKALTTLATAAVQAGDTDHAYHMATQAEALARTVTRPHAQAQVLTTLATAAVVAGDPDYAHGIITDAAALTGTIADVGTKVPLFLKLATAAAQVGDLELVHRLVAEVEGFVETATSPSDRVRQLRQLRDLTIAIAKAGEPDRAEALARTITDPKDQAEALTTLAGAAVQAGDADRACRVAADAEALARTITDPKDQAEALTMLAGAAIQAGDADRACRVAADAEALARTISDGSWTKSVVLTKLAAVIAQVGDLDRAYRITIDAQALRNTSSVQNEITWVDAQQTVVISIAQAGDLDRAEALACNIADNSVRSWTFVKLIVVIARAGDFERAEALSRTLPNQFAHAQALAELATVAVQAGDPDRAHQIAADAEAVTRTFINPNALVRPLTTLATVVGQCGDLDHTRYLVALAASAGSAQIDDWIGVASNYFPSTIKEAGDAFIGAYRTART